MQCIGSRTRRVWARDVPIVLNVYRPEVVSPLRKKKKKNDMFPKHTKCPRALLFLHMTTISVSLHSNLHLRPRFFWR